jgi:HK97 gp10 family phage protein
MNIKVNVDTSNLRLEQAKEKIQKATQKALKDTVIDIAREVIEIHPWKTRTGNNNRSIKYEMQKLEGSVYSTSGYGGYLEVGTRFMPAFPYFRPALDRNIPKFPEKVKGYL